jgi:hypothetical protein
MRLQCPRCAQTERFLGQQSVRGSVSVIVDGGGEFVDNPTTCGHVDSEGLDFDDPEGPFVCPTCSEMSGKDVEAVDRDEDDDDVRNKKVRHD